MKRAYWAAFLGIALLFKGGFAVAEESGRVGNGGYGVKIDGQIYALDLAMRGDHLDPYLSNGVAEKLPQEMQDIVNYHLARIVLPTVVELVSKKLSELDAKTKKLGVSYSVETLIRNMDNYRWIGLPDLACTDVGDATLPFPNKVQLAYRQGMWIRFCKDFSSIGLSDQAALVLHEIVYALHREGQPFVSHLIGYLFSSDFQNFSDPAQRELRTIIESLKGGNQNNPQTIYDRLDHMMNNARLPQIHEFPQSALWRGRCVERQSPDTYSSALLSVYTGSDPLMGKYLVAIPSITKPGDLRYETYSIADLQAAWTGRQSMVMKEPGFGAIRTNDFSWTGTYQHSDEEREFFYYGSASFQLKASLSDSGQPLLLLTADSRDNVNAHYFKCYFNKRILGQ